MMFSFFGSYNYVFQLVYHFNQKEIGLTFLGITIGFILGAIAFAVLDATFYNKAVAAAPNNIPEPEHRLYAAMFGSLLLPIGLFVLAPLPYYIVYSLISFFTVVRMVGFKRCSLDRSCFCWNSLRLRLFHNICKIVPLSFILNPLTSPSSLRCSTSSTYMDQNWAPPPSQPMERSALSFALLSRSSLYRCTKLSVFTGQEVCLRSSP